MRPAAAKARRPKGQSDREQEFLRRWIELDGPRLEAQFMFHPTRRWKLDWAHPASRVAIEIHGGIWIAGRHVRGLGFAGDRLKMNAALRLDWKVFELTTADLADERIYGEILDEIARREAEGIADRSGLEPLGQVYADRRRQRATAK